MMVRQALNVVELLEFFAARGRPATLSEISDALDWPRSSTFNLLSTLSAAGYLYEPRAKGGFFPSPSICEVARLIGEAEPLTEELEQLADDVAAATGETTAICAPSGVHALFLYVVESKSVIRYFAKIGSRTPIHASSSGRALLAQFSEAERHALYRKVDFEAFTPTSPTDVFEVEARLKQGVARGFHSSTAEYSADLVGVAVSLRHEGRRLSLVTAGPISRCEDKVEDFGKIVRSRARKFLAAAVA